jgi:hypothetical protein
MVHVELVTLIYSDFFRLSILILTGLATVVPAAFDPEGSGHDKPVPAISHVAGP